MTSQDILEKAIQKAIAGGWKRKWYRTYSIPKIAEYILLGDRYMAFIFNRDFAKALWGEEYGSVKLGSNGLEVEYKYSHPNWQRHLMQMVIADDPIKYLEEHMDV